MEDGKGKREVGGWKEVISDSPQGLSLGLLVLESSPACAHQSQVPLSALSLGDNWPDLCHRTVSEPCCALLVPKVPELVMAVTKASMTQG